MSGNGRSGLRPASSDINQILNSAGNSSSPSVGASSLVTDANSVLSGGSQLQRSTSFNNESYLRLPASPMSFSSNISGSSVVDGCSIVQQSSFHEQVQKQGLSTATSQLMQQEPAHLMNAHKRQRSDGRHEDALQPQLIQQFLLRHENMQPQSQQNIHLQSIIQQQRLMQHQQQQQRMMQSFPQMHRPPITLHQQQHLRQHLQPTSIRQSFNNGICSRRLMQYLYHQRHRPADNTIVYWTKFVMEYFAVRAKKRWCLSLYDSIGSSALGVFPQLSVGAWQCDLCGSRSGKGFEATFEVLPRLFQIKFDNGVVDENIFLDVPQECRLSSGIMILKYEKAVRETVFEHLRVVHEGQLRIIFTPDLKILSWEFCAQRHEEFLPRRLLAPQVNQLLQVAQKYQTAVTENNSTGLSNEDLQSSCNMFAAAGRQLARNLEAQSINDLGFSKRFVRCLQISEVVGSMKDLIDFSQEQKVGPIESLKNYPRLVAAKLQKRKMDSEQLMGAHSLGDQIPRDKVIGAHAGINSYINNNPTASQVNYSSQQSLHALNSYQNLLRNSSSFKKNMYQEAFSSTDEARDAQPSQLPGSASSTVTNTSVNNLTAQLQQQPQQRPSSASMNQQNDLQTEQVNQQLQQRALHQMLQDMMNNRGAQHQSSNPANANHTSRDVIGAGIAGTPFRIDPGSIRNANAPQNMPKNLPSRSTTSMSCITNSFNSIDNSTNPSISSSNVNSQLDFPENMDLAEMERIAQEFWEKGMLDGDSW